MPSTPTSKAQVQAYKFVLRRMQSALIRRDPVMMHDPQRTHSRAMMVGAALAAVALAGFAVYGLLSPAPTLPDKDNTIVLSKQSGQMYVLSKNHDGDRKLTPTFNLASARLLIKARQEKNDKGGGSADADKAVEPKEVDQGQLSEAGVGRLTGIPDAPNMLPTKDDESAAGKWAVCDDYARDPDLPNPTSENKVKTTVLSGVNNLGGQLGQKQGFLVRERQSGKTYLIYRTPSSANKPESDVVRAEVDLAQGPIKQVFQKKDTKPRVVSAGLINSIPAVQGLTPPHIDGAGEQAPGALGNGLGMQVGDAFKVKYTSGETKKYLIQKDGKQDVTDSSSAADVVRSEIHQQSTDLPPVQPNQVVDIPDTKHPTDVSQFPKHIPELLEQNTYPTMCLGWNPNTDDPKDPKEHTVLTVGKRLPIPKKVSPVKLSNPNADGQRVDSFYMPSGKAAFVRSAQSPAQFKSGPRYVVSDRGIRYSIPDKKTAAALGLKKPAPAPESIARLLSPGADLNTKAVQRTFDSLNVPQNAGSYPSESKSDSDSSGSDGEQSSGSG